MAGFFIYPIRFLYFSVKDNTLLSAAVFLERCVPFGNVMHLRRDASFGRDVRFARVAEHIASLRT